MTEARNFCWQRRLFRHLVFRSFGFDSSFVIRHSDFVIPTMFVLIATCETYRGIARITRALLERYWARHPRVEMVWGAAGGPWLHGVVELLERQSDALFILMLDDYGLCGPAKVEGIVRAAELMRRDLSVGMFPLCWYPAARRITRADCPEMVTLVGAPILLQAAIWRRKWFLELARSIDPRASAWGFEMRATQVAKGKPAAICAMDMPAPVWVGGNLVDGFDKRDWLLPYHNLMHRGKPNLQHEGPLRSEGFAFPARGLGDTIATLANATGLSAVAHAWEKVSGRDCGCEGRRVRLNELAPYRDSR
jgi:hypothetical protein